MFKKDKIEKACLPVVCVFKDVRANIFTAPMVFDNEACAERYFASLVDKMGVKVCDYELYILGHYYDKTGDFLPLNDNAKYLLKSGIEYKDRVDLLEIKETKIKYLIEELSKLTNEISKLQTELYNKTNPEESEEIIDEE